jgi:hypothetical protein
VALDWRRNPPTYGRRNSPTAADYLLHAGELKDWVVRRHAYLSSALSELRAPDSGCLDLTHAVRTLNFFLFLAGP